MPEGQEQVEEIVTAVTVPTHHASQNILRKCGFEKFVVLTEPDLRDPSVDISLDVFRFFPARVPKN